MTRRVIQRAPDIGMRIRMRRTPEPEPVPVPEPGGDCVPDAQAPVWVGYVDGDGVPIRDLHFEFDGSMANPPFPPGAMVATVPGALCGHEVEWVATYDVGNAQEAYLHTYAWPDPTPQPDPLPEVDGVIIHPQPWDSVVVELMAQDFEQERALPYLIRAGASITVIPVPRMYDSGGWIYFEELWGGTLTLTASVDGELLGSVTLTLEDTWDGSGGV